MCVVSNIGGYYGDHYPWMPTTPVPVNPWPALPKTQQDDIELMRKFRELIDAAKKADEAAKEKDCEQPLQKEFIKQVLDRLDAIEKQLSRNGNA